MKKRIAIVMLLLLLGSLAACGEKPAVSSDDHSDWVWVRDLPSWGALSDTGYYMAGVDNDFFYVDRTGKKVADYKDCASFLDGYALVIEEDGMAYLVDEELNKVSEGQPADSVYRSNGALVSVKDGVETYFVPEYK